MPGPAPESRARAVLRDGAHLAVLTSLALAQPLFDILGRNPTFFAVRGSSSAEIVLFAVALVVLPPVLLVLVELAVGLVSRPLARALHLVFVAALVALVVLEVLTKSGSPSGAAAVVTAAAIGAAAAFVYARMRAARSFVSVLLPAPVVFLALFLFHSPVSKLVFVATPEVQAATVRAKTPVVLIVFDEFSTVGLMSRRQGVDAKRFPSFASLAGDSTWYRSATTRYWLSEGAVPSILTGREPRPDAVPVYSDYPQSLFTLLGGSYRVRAVETLTRLCPPKLCKEQPRSEQDTTAATGAYGSLASDVGIVYLHMLLPTPYADRLPRIDDSWGDFGKAGEPDGATGSTAESEPCARSVCAFTDLVDADRTPTLYFLHSLLPHVPYVFLPSGKHYAVDARVLRGMENGVWRKPWPALQSYQRYLLQIGYTDRALGHILRRLRSTGVYSRALVIVTADHGVSFRLGQPRRLPKPGNLDDIAFVPLFVKLPGQTTGRIVDSPAETIDVVPTIARALGVSIPWHVDGKPLVGGGGTARGGSVTVVTQHGHSVGAPLASLRAKRATTLAWQTSLFGNGSLSAVYRLGPRRALVGADVARLPVRPSARQTVQLDDRTLLAAVDRGSDVLPSYVEGKIKGAAAGQALAVAVNGRVAATTRTFEEHGSTRFSAFVPEGTLRTGANDVAVYAVAGSASRPVLEQLRDGDLGFVLAQEGGHEVIRSGGKTIAIRPGLYRGSVRVAIAGTGYVFSGNAGNAKRRPVRTLVVFDDGRAVYWGRGENLRPHHILGQAGRGGDAFAFELPQGLLPPRTRDDEVRVFAVDAGRASELGYAGDWFWAH